MSGAWSAASLGRIAQTETGRGRGLTQVGAIFIGTLTPRDLERAYR